MAMPTVNSVGAIAAATTAISPAPGAGHTADDIDILLIETAGGSLTLATPAGFAELTAVSGQTIGSGATLTAMWVFWRRWNGTDGTPTTSGPLNHASGRMISISGCKTSGDPWNTTATGVTDSSADQTAVINGGTTSVADCLILAMVAQSLPDATSTTEFTNWANADLASVAEQIDNANQLGNGGAIGLATGQKAVAGTFGTTTADTATSSTRVCAMVALEPATGTQTLSGSLFTKAPTFFTGVVTPGVVTLTGTLFQKAPTFFTGAVSLASGPQTLNGVLFTKAPTFPTGTLAATYQLTGVLFSKAPTFPVGTVTPVYSLAGVLFVKAPTFPTGTLSARYTLAGVLFQKVPTFPTGAVTVGAVTLSGVLFQKAPAFNAGVLQQQGGPQLLGGTLFVKTPTFPTGVVIPGAVSIAGVLFQKAPTFPQGSVVVVLTGTLYQNVPTFPQGAVIPDQPLTGTLFQKSPSFFVGTLGVAGALTGILFTNAPVFFTGTLAQGAASFWQPNPVGYTVNPVAFVRVGAPGPSPWGATLSGEPFEKAPLFPVGAVT